MNALRVGILLAAAFVGMSAHAQTLYVTDRLQLGLHVTPSLSSPIVALLPTGSVVEVLERNETMVRGRTADGVEGWADAALLIDRRPDETRVQELEAELAGAQAALADVEAQLVQAQERAAPSEATVDSDDDAMAIPSQTLREMQRLAEENQRLKQQLAELEAVERMQLEQQRAPAAPRAAAPAPGPSVPRRDAPRWETLWNWDPWQLLLIASVLLLAFSAGGWVVDWGVRRRHGGFRI